LVRRSLVGVVVILGIIVFYLARISDQPITIFIRQIPETGLIYTGTAIQSAKSAVTGGAQSITHARDQQNDIQKLREENIQLKIQIGKLRSELEGQHTSRDMMSRFPGLAGLGAVTAPIILRSPSLMIRQALIPVGRTRGVRDRSAVLSPDGVVGVVSGVEANYSVIAFMTEPRFVLGGKIERTGETVILEGNGSGGTLKFLPLRSDVHAGDVLLTSGQDGVFPEGLRVGVIIKTIENLGRAMLDAEFAPSVSFEKLKWVVVIEPRHLPAAP
ncbi:MAG: rod shape-determining protein MreC, partial [bacterium]